MKAYWILDERPSERRYFCDKHGKYIWDTEKEANEAQIKENHLIETRRLSVKRINDFEMISTLSQHDSTDLFDYINNRLNKIEKINMKIEEKDKEDKERIESYIKGLMK